LPDPSRPSSWDLEMSFHNWRSLAADQETGAGSMKVLRGKGRRMKTVYEGEVDCGLGELGDDVRER
jgi:hypothetical protein